MKKIALATLLVLAVGSASAVELGVNAIRDYGQTPDRNGWGVTVGEHFGKFSATAGFDRFTEGKNDTNRYSLVGGYDVAKFGDLTITPKLGVAYIDPTTTKNGLAGTVGVGASYAVTKTVALTADYRYQSAIQSRVNNFNGNTVTGGIKVSF